MSAPQTHVQALIRPLVAGDLDAADRIIRVAFGTFLGLPNPGTFMGDANYGHTRWKADPASVLGAEYDGKLIASNFATNWGSFGFFGPLTVEPEYWNRGIAQQLLGPTMEIFRRWGNRHLGLYTFPGSSKHMLLYQKFGFWPRDLVANVSKTVAETPQTSDMAADSEASLFSESNSSERSALLAACREVTDSNFEGLDVQREIRTVSDQRLGDTVFAWDTSKLAAFAVCHSGAGTEAGSGVCYIKFAAVRPGTRAPVNFQRLLDRVAAFASASWAQRITAGVNLARRDAFQALLNAGFRVESQGIAMETGDGSAGYNHRGTYILDDWR